MDNQVSKTAEAHGVDKMTGMLVRCAIYGVGAICAVLFICGVANGVYETFITLIWGVVYCIGAIAAVQAAMLVLWGVAGAFVLMAGCRGEN